MWNIVDCGKSIKCICKYWNKGSDIFVFTVTDSMNATVTNCHATTVMRLGDVYFKNYNTDATSISHFSSADVLKQAEEFISLKKMSFSAILLLISEFL